MRQKLPVIKILTACFIISCNSQNREEQSAKQYDTTPSVRSVDTIPIIEKNTHKPSKKETENWILEQLRGNMKAFKSANTDYSNFIYSFKKDSLIVEYEGVYNDKMGEVNVLRKSTTTNAIPIKNIDSLILGDENLLIITKGETIFTIENGVQINTVISSIGEDKNLSSPITNIKALRGALFVGFDKKNSDKDIEKRLREAFKYLKSLTNSNQPF